MNDTLIAALLILALALAGCGSKESDQPAEPAVEQTPPPQMIEQEVRHGVPQRPGNAVSGPVEYIDTVVTLGMQQDYRMKKANVQAAVQQYNAMQFKYPATVEDIVKEGLLVKVPSLDEGDRWDLNPETGEVRIMRLVPKR